MRARKLRFRPMGLGDILDEAFDLYKTNFVLLVGISAVLYMPFHFFSTLVLLPIVAPVQSAQPPVPSQVFDMATNLAAFFAVYLIALLVVYSISEGALVYAISRRYLEEDASIGSSYGFILRRLGGFVGAVLLYGTIVLAPVAVVLVLTALAVLAGGPLGFAVLILIIPAYVGSLFFWTRLLFTPTAFVVEAPRPVAALTRAWQLSAGHGWRIFGIWFLTAFIVGIIQSMVTQPVSLFVTFGLPAGSAVGYALNAGAAAVAGTVLAPVASIVGILLYYDLRIRKEGFDLQMLAQNLAVASGQALPGTGAPAVSPSPAADPSSYPKCAYCRFPIYKPEDQRVCPSCQAVLHTSCWAEYGGCATPGCAAAPAARGPQT